MGWLSNLLGGASAAKRNMSAPTAAELEDVMRTYLEVQADEGATGDPTDYARTVRYVKPSRSFPPKWPGSPLCGCCSALFSLEARRDGMWLAQRKKDGRLVPLCAVCITHLNAHYMPQHGRQALSLPRSYDHVGQQLAERFGTESVQKVAVVRIALMRRRCGR